MADYYHRLESGGLPWQPSSTASLVRTYHKYGIPLIGLVEDQGDTYLFVRRYRGEENLSVWMYVPVSTADLTRLDTACSSPAKFSAILDEYEDRREVTYALAHEENGVISTRRHASSGHVRDDVEQLITDAGLPQGAEDQAEINGLLELLP